MKLDIYSVGVGKPVVYDWGTSGIRKHPVDGALAIFETGCEGDGQADLKSHGGPDKAACCYPLEHYPYWLERLGKRIWAHSFGENLSLKGATEDDICVGDIFECGQLILQVSQPRRPCWKLARLHDRKEIVLWAQDTGKTGWYTRVLQPGVAVAGARLQLSERLFPNWTISRANTLIYSKNPNPAHLRELSEIPALSESWRDTLRRKASETEGVGRE